MLDQLKKNGNAIGLDPVGKLGVDLATLEETYYVVKQLFIDCIKDLLANNKQEQDYTAEAKRQGGYDEYGVFVKGSGGGDGKAAQKTYQQGQVFHEPNPSRGSTSRKTNSEDQPNYEGFRLVLEAHYKRTRGTPVRILPDDFFKFIPTKKEIYHTQMPAAPMPANKKKRIFRFVKCTSLNDPSRFSFVPSMRWKRLEPFSVMTSYASQGLGAENSIFLMLYPSTVEAFYTAALRAKLSVRLIGSAWSLAKTLQQRFHARKDFTGAIIRKKCASLLLENLSEDYDELEKKVIPAIVARELEHMHDSEVSPEERAKDFRIPLRQAVPNMGPVQKVWFDEMERALGESYFAEGNKRTLRDSWLEGDNGDYLTEDDDN